VRSARRPRGLITFFAKMDSGKLLARFFVDSDSPVPAHAQLKSQIRLARTYHDIESGDVLPSIRALARPLGVGDGVVRRAYRELCEAGLLGTDNRKHVVMPSMLLAPEASALAEASADQCHRLIAWAGEARVSTIALGRLLLARAFAQEAALPSYVFVDICRLAAEESARDVAKAWEIKIRGLAFDDFAALSPTDRNRLSAVLVNEHLYEDALNVVGEGSPHVFSMRMRCEKYLDRRVQRLPAKSHTLIVTSTESSAGERALLRHCRHVFSGSRRLHAKVLSKTPDLAALVKSRHYNLVLLSPLVWDQTPKRITRMTSVRRMAMEPDPRSLENVRIAAGVLL